jgi:hypothetical protein
MRPGGTIPGFCCPGFCPLFHPRRQRWSRHFRWSADGLHLEGLTRVGRATVERLALNHWRQIQAQARRRVHPDLFP